MNFIEYPDADMMMIDLANRIAGDLNAALHHEERVCLAVPGGTTPGPLFDDLCAADLPWDRVDVMLTDERWVPTQSARSNTKLIRERLLVNRAAAARHLPLFAPADTPEEVLPELEAMIAPELPIAVLLLGMGTDMHTASIFPGADNLTAALDPHAPILVPMRAPGAQEPRITISARVLDGALRKHIIIVGAEKREAFEKAQHLNAKDAPIKAVLTGADVHWAP
ncbi:6-phosphogluconolactonase [Planktotalea sp.]|uniref:6-phosphogluconolactonase n=1 Tax=Planktotalea sp. TaxID=2029877 RepID=UPI003D6C0BA4